MVKGTPYWPTPGKPAGFDTFFLTATLPPCTIYTLKIPGQIELVDKGGDKIVVGLSGQIQVTFSDGEATWYRSDQSLSTHWTGDFAAKNPQYFSYDPFDAYYSAKQAGTLSPASDCGDAAY